jgi:hypothetical protein
MQKIRIDIDVASLGLPMAAVRSRFTEMAVGWPNTSEPGMSRKS